MYFYNQLWLPLPLPNFTEIKWSQPGNIKTTQQKPFPCDTYARKPTQIWNQKWWQQKKEWQLQTRHKNLRKLKKTCNPNGPNGDGSQPSTSQMTVSCRVVNITRASLRKNPEQDTRWKLTNWSQNRWRQWHFILCTRQPLGFPSSNDWSQTPIQLRNARRQIWWISTIVTASTR